MDPILSAHTHLTTTANLTPAISTLNTLISELERTRAALTPTSTPQQTALHLAKLHQPLKRSFAQLDDDLKEVNKGLNQYQKALKEKFKNAALPSAPSEVGVEGRGLVERAIAMHLLREGLFGVARTFVREVGEGAISLGGGEDGMRLEGQHEWVRDFTTDSSATGADEKMDDGDEDGSVGEEDGEVPERGHLQHQFAEMYHILDALRHQQNLAPAIDWARQHSGELEARGSNLEFELSRLKFVELYCSGLPSHTDEMYDDDPSDSNNPDNEEETDYTGPLLALAYARQTFPTFTPRNAASTSSLLGSLAFSPSLPTSPYAHLFPSTPTSSSPDTAEIQQTFTQTYLTHLRLPPTSPLYLASTAGTIALPILSKVERIMAQTRGQWTSVNELPVETPLPPGLSRFHAVFVCPVSKEQATDLNPPVMMPCGHVIAKESLEMHGRGKSRVKCPYCPGESRVGEGRRVYI